MAEREHLDLLELVRAEDAARVLARRAGLAPEARREPAVAQRQVVLGQDLAHVQRRQRDLGGADQEQLGRRSRPRRPARGRLGEEARADERLLAHQHRRHDGREALAARACRARTARSRRAAARRRRAGRRSASRRARAALHVDHRPGQLEVVARLEVELRLAAGRHVRTISRVLLAHAVGGALVRQVRQRRACAVSNSRVGLAQRAPRAPSRRVAQLGRAAAISAAASRPARLASPIACAARVALGAQLVDLRLQRAPALVEREHLVEQRRRPRAARAPRARASVSERMRRMSSMRSSLARLARAASASSSCATPSSCTDGHDGQSASPTSARVGVRDRHAEARPTRASRGRSRRRRTRCLLAREAQQLGDAAAQPAGLRDAGRGELEEVRQRLGDERAAAEARQQRVAQRVHRRRASPTVTIFVVGSLDPVGQVADDVHRRRPRPASSAAPRRSPPHT